MSGNAEMSMDEQMARFIEMAATLIERFDALSQAVGARLETVITKQDSIEIDVRQLRAEVDSILIACQEMGKTLTAMAKASEALEKLNERTSGVRRRPGKKVGT